MNNYWVRLSLSIIFLLAAGILNFVTGSFIVGKFENVIPPDLLFSITPYVSSMQYVTDIVVIVSGIILFIVTLKTDYKKLPKVMNIIALGYLLRAIFITLTPLGAYFGVDNSFGISNLKPHGAFPSGHTMFAFLAYYLTDKKYNKIKILLFILAIIEATSLILSRGHYSIDIIGGFLVAYFVCHQFAKND